MTELQLSEKGEVVNKTHLETTGHDKKKSKNGACTVFIPRKGLKRWIYTKNPF